MRSSFSRALKPEAEPDIRPFQYAETTDSGVDQAPSSGAAESALSATGPEESANQAAREQAAREAGRQEGEAQARAGFELQLNRSCETVRSALEDFARQRSAYYRQVEKEVVQLALSIARKVLHREAQADPLLLAGLVRVALDQIESNTKTAIRVHPRQAHDFREFFRGDGDQTPEVIDDPNLEPDGCILQTELGTAEFGIEVQLKEIEQGLADLMAQLPQATK